MFWRDFRKLAACGGIALALHATGPQVAAPLVAAAQANEMAISFPLPPPDVQAANAARPQRRDAVVKFLACAREVDALNLILGQNAKPDEGGVNAIVIAKMAWLGQLDRFDHESLRLLVCENSITFRADDPVVTAFLAGGPQAVNDRARAIDRQCGDILLSAVRSFDGLMTLTFKVNGLCMRTEVNRLIGNLTAPDQLGSSGLPCLSGIETPHEGLKFTVEGELDVHVRDFTRMFFLNKNRSILDEEVRNRARDKLMIAWGPVGDDDYSILECGNTEHSEGTPQELLDERDFLDETAEDIGDAALWLAKRLAFLALLAAFFASPIATLVGQILPMIGSGAAIPGAIASPAMVATIAVIAAGEIRIGETENHRLMIETSRYLKNQIILDEVPNHPNIGELEDDQEELKAWLLAYLGEIARHDFAEYNARPYQRYSLVALLNLADFSTDPDVRRAARMVLEFALAKFAVASREGVRVVPYRRLIDAMNKNPNMFEFGGEGSDHPVAMMLYYAGQTQRLPTRRPALSEAPSSKELPYGTPASMIYAATSSFVPDNDIIDLAIDKSRRYFQKFRSDGIEIYTSTPSFTIAAGGIRTDQVLTLQFGPIPTGLGKTNDLGTGVPTSFIPSGTGHVNRVRFMRFEGVVQDVGDVDPNTGFGKEGRINDHNVCLWQGFACGLNYQDAENLDPAGDPGGMAACFKPGLDGAPPQWAFLDSKACKATMGAPPFFVARFLLPCTNKDSGCLTNGRFGFFEAVDAPAVGFDEFRRRVVAENPVVFPGNPSPFDAVNQNGHYRMFGSNRERLLFSVVAHKADPDLPGVLAIGPNPLPRIPDWPFAEGEIINSKGDGTIRFANPKFGRSITWDFSDAQHPKRIPSGE